MDQDLLAQTDHQPIEDKKDKSSKSQLNTTIIIVAFIVVIIIFVLIFILFQYFKGKKNKKDDDDSSDENKIKLQKIKKNSLPDNEIKIGEMIDAKIDNFSKELQSILNKSFEEQSTNVKNMLSIMDKKINDNFPEKKEDIEVKDNIEKSKDITYDDD